MLTIIKSALLGLALVATTLAVFASYGPSFFIDGRSPFQLNFAAGALIGLLIGWFAPRLVGARVHDHLRSAVLIAVPILVVQAVVTSHFQVVFKDLNPVMDKVYGALMLWSAAFVLIGGTLRRKP
jgi:hypothetical protein